LLVCPSCGSSVEGDLCLGCPSCGARAVGPPLAKAEHQLPSFGRASLACAAGIAMAGGFAGLVIAILIDQKPGRLGFWTIVSAGEIAAWRVRWIVLPLSIAILWGGARIVTSIKLNPAHFIGLRAARAGFLSAALVTAVIGTLIGVTVPARLRQRQDSIEAAMHARGYTLHRAFMEYRELHGTLPADPDKYIEALRTLPDPDGAIAEALKFVDPNGYQASAQLAAASTKVKPLVTRGVALRSVTTVATPETAGVSFTTYELRLPSEHRMLGPDDDFVMRDGVIYKASELASTTSPSTRPRIP
jgi:hypothetical protein